MLRLHSISSVAKSICRRCSSSPSLRRVYPRRRGRDAWAGHPARRHSRCLLARDWTALFRIDFFGDEIESIRRFDPDTQRSASTLDEALLLPLTETPVTEKILTAINARLTRSGLAGAQLEGGEEPNEYVLMWRRARGMRRYFPVGSFLLRLPAQISTYSTCLGRPRASFSKSLR